MPTVRTIFHPDRPIEVTDADAAQMRRDGILAPEPADAPPAAPATAPTTPQKEKADGQEVGK